MRGAAVGAAGRARHRGRQRLERRQPRGGARTCRVEPIQLSSETAASRTAATSGWRAGHAPYVLLLESRRSHRRRRRSTRSSRVLEQTRGRRGRRRSISIADGMARFLAAAVPAPPLDVCAGALPASALSRRRLDRRAGPRSGGLRSARAARLGLGRLHPRAPAGARSARRIRRGLLHVLRGHRPLPAPARRRLRRSSSSRRRVVVHEGGASAPRAALLPVLAAQPDPLRDEAPRPPRGRCSNGSASRSARSRTSARRARRPAGRGSAMRGRCARALTHRPSDLAVRLGPRALWPNGRRRDARCRD